MKKRKRIIIRNKKGYLLVGSSNKSKHAIANKRVSADRMKLAIK